MKATYQIVADPKVHRHIMPGALHMHGVDVEWNIENELLVGASLIIRGLKIPVTGSINTRERSRDVIAYRVVCYINDYIYSLTGLDSFQPRKIFTISPMIAAETSTEEAILMGRTMTHSVSLPASFALSRSFNGTLLSNHLDDAPAIAHYARAMRNVDPFVQFEEFFKAIEFFVPPDTKNRKGQQLRGDELNKSISDQAKIIDSRFTVLRVQQLHELRNRLTHSRAILGHLDSHELDDIVEVQTNLDDMQLLARIMIWKSSTPWI